MVACSPSRCSSADTSAPSGCAPFDGCASCCGSPSSTMLRRRAAAPRRRWPVTSGPPRRRRARRPSRACPARAHNHGVPAITSNSSSLASTSLRRRRSPRRARSRSAGRSFGLLDRAERRRRPRRRDRRPRRAGCRSRRGVCAVMPTAPPAVARAARRSSRAPVYVLPEPGGPWMARHVASRCPRADGPRRVPVRRADERRARRLALHSGRPAQQQVARGAERRARIVDPVRRDPARRRPSSARAARQSDRPPAGSASCGCGTSLVSSAALEFDEADRVVDRDDLARAPRRSRDRSGACPPGTCVLRLERVAADVDCFTWPTSPTYVEVADALAVVDEVVVGQVVAAGGSTPTTRASARAGASASSCASSQRACCSSATARPGRPARRRRPRPRARRRPPRAP